MDPKVVDKIQTDYLKMISFIDQVREPGESSVEVVQRLVLAEIARKNSRV